MQAEACPLCSPVCAPRPFLWASYLQQRACSPEAGGQQNTAASCGRLCPASPSVALHQLPRCGASCGRLPLLWLASLAKSPEAEFPVLAKASSFARLCVHPRRAFLACWFPRNFLACQPLLQSLVDQNSTKIFSAQWISSVVEAESWSCEGGEPVSQVCFLCGYTPSAPGFCLSS